MNKQSDKFLSFNYDSWRFAWVNMQPIRKGNLMAHTKCKVDGSEMVTFLASPLLLGYGTCD